MSIDLSDSLVSSLISLVSTVSDSLFTEALAEGWKNLANENKSHQTNQTQTDQQQQQQTSFHALNSLVCSFLLDSARCSASTAEIVSHLSDHQFPSSKLPLLARSLESHRIAFRSRLIENFVKTFPSLVGASYRLSHLLKSNISEQIRQPLFAVKLDLTSSNAAGLEQFQFHATLPELQDLLSKVKEAVKQAQNEREKES